MQLDDERHLAREVERPEQEGRKARVPTDRVQFARSQAAGPRQRGHVDGDLAEVVELGGGDDALTLPLGKLDEVEEALHVSGHPLGVLARRRVASVDDVGERLERLRRLLPQLLERRLRPVERGKQRREERDYDEVVRRGQAEGEEDPEAPFADGGPEILDENLDEELHGPTARGERGAEDVDER